MTLDAGIYSQIQQPAAINPLQDAAQFQQAQALQNQNKLAALGFAQKQQDQQDQGTIRNALLGLGAGATDEQRITALKATGLPAGFTQADALGTSIDNRAKTQAQTNKDNASAEKDRLADAITKQAQIAQAAGAATDQASWERGLIIAHSLGADISKVPPVYDPAVATQLRNQAMTGTQQLEQVWKQKGYDLDVAKQTEDVRHNTRTENISLSNNAATVGATIRGQNLTDARMRDATANAADAVKVPTGYRANPDGTLAFIPGGPADPARQGDKPLTETQGKATTFAARMEDASRTIDALESQGVSGSDFRTLAAGNGYTNWLASPQGQQYRQAQENWVTANLRQESGAAIGVDEMAKDVRKFFPAPGDAPAVREQKAQARAVAQRGMVAQTGPGAKQLPTIVGTPPAAGASGGWSVKRVN